jgi:hypothetical protein
VHFVSRIDQVLPLVLAEPEPPPADDDRGPDTRQEESVHP